MKETLKKYEKIKIAIIIWLICFIPRLLVNVQVPFISMISDEISSMSAATIGSGLEWKNVVGNAGYYGGGFTILFTPLFSVIDNPIVLYHVMINICAALQAFIGVLAYIIIIRHTEVKSQINTILFSVVASFIVTRRATNVTNETPLVVMYWLIVLIILELYKAEKKRKDYLSIALALMLGYVLTLHTRAITLSMAFLLVYFLVLIFYKKSIVNIGAFITTWIVVYAISKCFIGYIQNYFFSFETTALLRNAEVSVQGIDVILDINNWIPWISMWIGQIGTITILTGGGFVIGIVIWGILVNQCLAGKKNIIEEKKLVVMTFSLACICATVLAFSVSSWHGNLATVMTTGVGKEDYALKALTYIRYFGPYVGPFTLMGLIYFAENHIRAKIWYMCAILSVISLFTFYIIPYIHMCNASKEVFIPFARMSNVAESGWFYIYGVMATLLMSGTLLILSHYKKFTWVLILLCLYLGYQYVYNGIYIDANTSETYTTKRLNTYTQLEEILEKSPEKIYIQDGERGENVDHQIYYTYQLLFKNKNVIPGLPSEENEAIFISNTVDTYKNIYDKGYLRVLLDDGCDYVYIKGDNIKQTFIEGGFELLDYNNSTYSIEMMQNELQDNMEMEVNIIMNQGTYEIDLHGILDGKYDNLNVEININGIEQDISQDLYQNGIFNLAILENNSSIQVRLTGDVLLEQKSNVINYRQISREYMLEFEFDYAEINEQLSHINEPVYFYEELGSVKLPDDRYEIISIQENIKLNDGVILCNKTNPELVNILADKIIRTEFNNYYILQERVSDEKEELEMKNYPFIYKRLSVGEYKVSFYQNESIAYKILSDEYNSDMTLLTEGATSIIMQVPYDLSNWHIEFYDAANERIDVLLTSITSISTQDDVYESIFDIVEGKVGTENSIYVVDSLIESEYNTDILIQYFKDYINWEWTDVCNEIKEQYDYIVVDRFQLLSIYLEKYVPIAENERYILLQNKEQANSEIFNINYLQDNNGLYTIPKGKYLIGFEIKTEFYNNQEIIFQVKVNGESYKETTLALNENNYEQDLVVGELFVNQMYDLSNVSFELVNGEYSTLQTVWIRQENAEFTLDLPCTEGNTEFILGSNETAIIGDNTLEAGSYRVKIYFEGEDVEFTATVNRDGVDMMDYNHSSNAKKIDGENVLLIEIFPTGTREHCNLTIKNSGNGNLKINKVEVIDIAGN